MSNAQKTPLSRSLENFGRRVVYDALQRLGRRLPCTVVAVQGAIVTVNFEIIEDPPVTLPRIRVPVATSIYVREPIQVGDKGYVQAADARLGAMTGLGVGVADLTLPGNLGALVFQPLGNAKWTEVDPNAVTVQGPNGAVLQDMQGKCVLTLTPDGLTVTLGDVSITVNASGITLAAGSASLVLAASGLTLNGAPATFAGNMTVAGTANLGVTTVATLTVNGVPYATHFHDFDGEPTGPVMPLPVP